MSELQATGEHFIPEQMSGELIDAEHQARYRLALQLAPGCDVLDAGCGVGWGSSLLLAAGARSVVGVDISASAVESARQRAPHATFVEGDLLQLPFDDDSFDLIACFEAIEHVADHERVLDELARVLRPDGQLAVSSPNPDVYPAGNPFHVRELRPHELLDAAARRFSHVELWRQYGLMASTLLRGGGTAAYEQSTTTSFCVADLAEGRDQYSLVVAGDSPPAELVPVVALSPSEQMDTLVAEAARLDQQSKLMAADQARVVAEREQMLAERADLLRQLEWADQELQRQQREIERAYQQVGAARNDREHVSLLLLRAEQRVARLTALAGTAVDSVDTIAQGQTQPA